MFILHLSDPNRPESILRLFKTCEDSSIWTSWTQLKYEIFYLEGIPYPKCTIFGNFIVQLNSNRPESILGYFLTHQNRPVWKSLPFNSMLQHLIYTYIVSGCFKSTPKDYGILLEPSEDSNPYLMIPRLVRMPQSCSK